MDLGGRWAATEADDDLRRSFPRPILTTANGDSEVPGHWRAEPALPPRTALCSSAALSRWNGSHPVERAWLVMDGIFYQSDVWLDGSYLGDTEGYFFPHAFDVTSALADRAEHVVALEVGCEPSRRSGRRSLMGVWRMVMHRPRVQPRRHLGPGGGGHEGSVRISSLRLAWGRARPSGPRNVRPARQLQQ